MRSYLVFIFLSIFLSIMETAGVCQRVSSAPGIAGTLEIYGQLRLEGKVAPQGVLVMLDLAPSRGLAPSMPGELERTTTDSAGKFIFQHIEQMGVSSGNKIFAVTAHYPGYKDTFQTVDLNNTMRGYVVIDMKRDTSRDVPNVPPEGAGSTLSANRPASPEAQEALARGQDFLLKKRDPKASIADFKKVLKLEPEYSPAYLLLGTAYMQTQDYSEAQSAFEKASRLDPKNSVAFLGIGASMNQRGDFDSSQKPLLRSLELNPNSAEAHYEMGRSLWAKGKWEQAEPHVRSALQMNKDFPLSHVLMGNIYLRRRDAQSALNEFQEYLRLDPEGAQADAVKEMIAKIQKAVGSR